MSEYAICNKLFTYLCGGSKAQHRGKNIGFCARDFKIQRYQFFLQVFPDGPGQFSLILLQEVTFSK